MANDLKKVGLIFNADGSTDFIKSMQLVNATLRENYQDFQLVQAQWDKSTTTSQKLTDKLNYLNDAYDSQKDKINVLRKGLEELESAENKDETAIMKKKTALTQAETTLQKYKNQVEETSKKIKLGTADLEDFAKKLDKVENVLTSAGKKLSIFSAAYVAGLGASAKSAIDFESAFAGVEKTVDATTEEMLALKSGIRSMAKEMPATTTEISAVAEAAGQLGIKTENILDFTKTMTNLGVATNLSSDQAATSLARIANITQMSQNNFDNLGSTIVALGNKLATTESEIVEMGLRLAGAGKQINLSEAQILSFAAALSSVGIEAEAGGSAFSKVMVNIESMVATNSKGLQDWAKVAGMSTKDFKKAWEEDAASALITFIEGLGQLDSKGGNAIVTLEELGITEVRMRDALLRASNAGDLFRQSLEIGNTAWEENNALTIEAEKRYATTESQMKILKNTLNDVGVTFGEIVLPYIQKFVEGLKDVFNWINNLDPNIQKMILVIGGLVASIGPLLIILGSLAGAISNMILLYTTYLAPMLAGIATGFSAIIIPALAIIAVITLIVFALKELWNTNEGFKNSVLAAIEGIKETFQIFWDSFLSPTIGFIIAAFEEIWETAIKPLWDNWIIFVDQIVSEMLKLWTSIKPIIDLILKFLGPVLAVVIAEISAVFAGMVTFVSGVLTTLLSFIGGIVSSIIKVIRGIIDFIVGVFTGDWSKAWQGLVTIFKGIFEGIASIVKAPLNIIISAINGLISGLNVFIRGVNKIQIPDWVPGVGGKNLNIGTIGTISYLAKGGDLLEGMAMVAEAGPELLMQQGNKTRVMPLSNGGGAIKNDLIDYKKIGQEFLWALSNSKFALDEDGFVKIVKDELYRVV